MGQSKILCLKRKTRAGERIRTPDLRFTKPPLCQLSYAGLRKHNIIGGKRKRVKPIRIGPDATAA